MSGCGDFDADTRNTKCLTNIKLHACSDVREMSVAEILTLQKHACVEHPITYDNYDTDDGVITPPALGRHRERWPSFGEYEYIPPQRWLHGAEHGAAVFLYNPCIKAEDLCQIRRFIGSIPDEQPYGDDATMSNRGPNAGRFRWILSPFGNLRTTMAMVCWGHVYYSNCFNPPAMLKFINQHYRLAWEDVVSNGPYNYLLVQNDSHTYSSLDCSGSTIPDNYLPIQLDNEGTSLHPAVFTLPFMLLLSFYFHFQ